MNDADKRLLEIYKMGWKDSGDNNPRFKEFSGTEYRAYQLGWCDFIIGDDVCSNDYQNNEEIIEIIKAL